MDIIILSMFWCWFCFEKTSKIETISKKFEMKCEICSGEKNVLTFVCGHNSGVKCYNENRICIICERLKTKGWFC